MPCLRRELPLPAPPVAKLASPAAPPHTPSLLSLCLFCGGLAVCLIGLGVLLHFLTREKTREQPDEDATFVAAIPPKHAKSTPRKDRPAEAKKPEPQLPVSRKTTEDKKQPETTPTADKKQPGKVEPDKIAGVQPPAKNPVPADPKPLPPPILVKKDLAPKPLPPNQGPPLVVLPFLNNDAIKIDGDLSDWKDIPPILLRPSRRRGQKQGRRHSRHAKSLRRLLSERHSRRGRYRGHQRETRNDPRIATNKWDFWNNDAVEVFIDTLDVCPPQRGAKTSISSSPSRSARERSRHGRL